MTHDAVLPGRNLESPWPNAVAMHESMTMSVRKFIRHAQVFPHHMTVLKDGGRQSLTIFCWAPGFFMSPDRSSRFAPS